jgi:hypothetical protein
MAAMSRHSFNIEPYGSMGLQELLRCIRHADILKRTFLCQVSDTGSPEPLVLVSYPKGQVEKYVNVEA